VEDPLRLLFELTVGHAEDALPRGAEVEVAPVVVLEALGRGVRGVDVDLDHEPSLGEVEVDFVARDEDVGLRRREVCGSEQLQEEALGAGSRLRVGVLELFGRDQARTRASFVARSRSGFGRSLIVRSGLVMGTGPMWRISLGSRGRRWTTMPGRERRLASGGTVTWTSPGQEGRSCQRPEALRSLTTLAVA
jgi:hypothetical protein